MNEKNREEKDSLGSRELPAEAYYGIQTSRALENFPVSGLKAHPFFVRAYVLIKKAAAGTHETLSLLDAETAHAVITAADEVLSGRFADQFVVDVFQAGAGTSFNMNVNEVLANRALEILGDRKGNYQRVSPNDHVNKSQSTNDTFPTAMHIASVMLLRELLPTLSGLARALREKGDEFAGIIKSGRTHLQDAVPVTLGQEFTAYAKAVEKAADRLQRNEEALRELSIGGSATGTGLNVPAGYREGMIRRLSELTGIPFRPAEDLREAMQSRSAMTSLSSTLRNLAVELTRIANDLRLLSSGPRTGLAEIRLPAVQPGSSIMPGKVNPVMAECLNMICYQVIGHDHVVTMAAQAGQMELNVMMPVMIHNLLSSMEILKNYLPLFTEKCVEGITANPERCRAYFEGSVGLATILNTHIGYLAAAELAKESEKTGVSVRELILKKNLLSAEELDRILDPDRITGQGGA
ncbi:MAG: aspartate ammonia-lyase [Deltaproteobacteria bacterium]|nr:aspartate ammonia-lyase [Deltaproteobacteria bacterium]